jgi:hypothetical protein
MILKLAIICLIAWSGSALAQSGVTNRRDARGNLVRDNGAYAQKGVNQGPINNGQIRNAPPSGGNTNGRNGSIR